MTSTDKDREIFLPGMKPVLELLEREPERVDMVYVRKGRVGAESSRLLDLCRDYCVRFSLVNDDVLSHMAGKAGHQGVIARLREASFTPWETFLEQAAHAPLPLMVALDQVQDPGNVGTLLRSAAAFGFDGVLLSDGCASVFAPKTLRASMGAAVRVPVMEVGAMPAAIAALRAKNITCLAAALYQSQPLSAARPGYPGGVCVVIGSEGQGLTEETIAACSGTVRIPMTDRVESLNAGIAGSILLWHFREESL